MMDGMMGHEHNGGAGHEHDSMMQWCMEMMNSMMGGGAMDPSSMSSMGLNLPLSLVLALILVGALGYLLGRARARA